MKSSSSEAIPERRAAPLRERHERGPGGEDPLDASPRTRLAPPLHEAELERELAGLRRAESVLVGVRLVTIVGWPFLLFRQPLPVPTEIFAAFYAVALVYAVSTAVLARTAGPRIRVVAIATKLACFLTGGLASIAIPAFYLTVIATAIRFGMRESFAIVAWTGVELAIVSQTAPGSTATLRQLATDVFYLSGVALMSGLLAGEARRQDRALLEPVATLIGGGVDKIDQGMDGIVMLWGLFMEEYLQRLDRAGLPRRGRLTLPLAYPWGEAKPAAPALEGAVA
jgi:hypothetical protein